MREEEVEELKENARKAPDEVPRTMSMRSREWKERKIVDRYV